MREIILKIAAVLTIILILAVPVWFLWNWLMPELFGMREVTLLEAFGINLLSGILFRSSLTK